MKVFLTGATGVVGRRVIPLLRLAGHDVTAIGRTRAKRDWLERLGVRVADVSLFDTRDLDAAIAGHQVVINLATHMPRSTWRMVLPGAWAENDRIRSEGSRNLVAAALAAGCERFVQESFAPVYPDQGEAFIEESVPIEPIRYNRSIVDAEQAAAHFSGEGRAGIVLRFAAFFGPDSRFLHDLMWMVRHGFAPLAGSPRAFISSISHDDAASAVVAALAIKAGIYNVSDDVPVTHREYANALAGALGVGAPRLPPAWATFLLGSPGRLLARSLRISNRKLRGASEWFPRYLSVREGFRAAVAGSSGVSRGRPAALGPG
jgi:2-alkyl-3-oxoalkanoate reductase